MSDAENENGNGSEPQETEARPVQVRRTALGRAPYTEKEREKAREARERAIEASPEAVDVTLEIMRDSLDPKVRLAAAAKVIDISVPKQTERTSRSLNVNVGMTAEADAGALFPGVEGPILPGDYVQWLYDEIMRTNGDDRPMRAWIEKNSTRVEDETRAEVFAALNLSPEIPASQALAIGTRALRKALSLPDDATLDHVAIELRALRAISDPRLADLSRMHSAMSSLDRELHPRPYLDPLERVIQETSTPPESEAGDATPEPVAGEDDAGGAGSAPAPDSDAAPSSEEPEVPEVSGAEIPEPVEEPVRDYEAERAAFDERELPDALQHDTSEESAEQAREARRRPIWDPDRKW